MMQPLQSHFTVAASPANATKRRDRAPRPISIRVTTEERAWLEQEAGTLTLSSYVRSRLLDTPGKRRQHRKQPNLDRVALARILALLGQSNLAPNLSTITEAVRTGTVELGPELASSLRQACADIALMRCDLIRALGIRAE
ncbi:hypothetical protein [Sphingomonas canadensis]|uniref:hypothetical protein n=1 Tax=Sphingomonas canadensis TaxID=1219257 RepID=UPI00222F78E1|nr:hypothetical protein [Sphingomonas canadensis]